MHNKLLSALAFSACLLSPLMKAETTSPAPVQGERETGSALVRNLTAGKPQTIVYYGTSLTAAGAWTRLLTESLKAKFPGQVTAHNTGGPGMHSGWGVSNLEQRVLSHKPDVVFLEFSVNDSVARFRFSPEQARNNLTKMIDRIQAALPGCEIILQTMNPVIDRPEGDSGWRPKLSVYQDVYREVAAERGLMLIDHMPAWTRLLETDEKRFRDYVPDGLHPDESGYQQIVMPELRRKLGLL